MSALEEVRKKYGREIPDLTPHTAGAEDPETTPEQIAGIIHKVFHKGHERRKYLDDLVAKKHSVLDYFSNGSYVINHSRTGQYADFGEQANHAYLKKNFSFLHDAGQGLGFDVDKGEESHGDFETYLAEIPDEDWESFQETLQDLARYPLLDEDGASELEMKESDRWVEEDGGPDLIKSMVDSADNAYEAYLLSKVTTDQIFEWMRDTENYPESQGQGDVWMNMEKLGEDTDNREWFLDKVEDDEAGWLAQKRKAFDEGAGASFEGRLKLMAAVDEQVAHVYNNLTDEDVWQMFLKAFPDAPREEDDPYWYRRRSSDDKDYVWKPGYKPEDYYTSWKSGFSDALDVLMEKEWFTKLVRNWFRRDPVDHPEFKFEALDQEDPDDPEIYMKYGGGLTEEKLYEDDKIVVFQPANVQTFNYHMSRRGLQEIDDQAWRDLLKYNDIFVIQAKQPVDLLGAEERKEFAVVYGSTDTGLRVWGNVPKLEELLADPNYGRSIRRMLLRYYRENLSRDSKVGHLLLQLGGARELRRGERRGEVRLVDYSVPLGLYYISKHKYRLAAKAFGRSLNSITPGGVWLFYDDVEDLTPVFKDDATARTVFSHDHHDWFDYLYDRSNLPRVEDVIPYLDKPAIDHIRSVLVNRRVWFPDGGPDERGEWVVLTAKNLAEYDDATILSWLANPSQEDLDDGVFDDVIEAIQYAGVDVLQATSQDNVYTGFIEAAVDAIGGKEHKWTTHPTNKGKKGEPTEAFAVFVPWRDVVDASDKYKDERGYSYDGDLESLMVEVNTDVAKPDVNRMEASWRDVNKEWAKENLHRIYDLEPPDPIPGAPNYLDPAQGELPIPESLDDPDDPSAMPDLLSGIPIELERRVKAILADSMKEHSYTVENLKFELRPSQEYSQEEIDASDGRLYNRFSPHRILIISYQQVPVPEMYGAATYVFRKVREQVVNVFRDYVVGDSYLLYPQSELDASMEGMVYFQYMLFPQPPTAELPPDEEETPF